jgi:hypothetical protein
MQLNSTTTISAYFGSLRPEESFDNDVIRSSHGFSYEETYTICREKPSREYKKGD